MFQRVLLFALILIYYSCNLSNPKHDPEKAETLFTLLGPDETGIEFINSITEDEENNHLVNDMLISGAGVAIADINNDGYQDLFFTGNQVPDRLYLNQGNLKFKDITDEAGILKDQIWSSGATFADINNDGYQDLYICKYVYDNEQLGENLLYINNGDLTFSEKAAHYGLADRGFSVQATFFDIDQDGFLDLYLINQPPSQGNRRGNKITLTRLKSKLYTDKVYKNMGDGNFFDISEWVGIRNLAFGLSATVADFNNDTWPDIYVANDYEKPDELYIHTGKDSKMINRINQMVKHISNFSMGADAADFDNDGHLDIVVVDMVAEDHKRIKTNMGAMDPDTFWDIVEKGWHYQYMFNTLQKNNGNGTFTEMAHLAGVSNTDWSWSALFADFDNDGLKDLFVTNGVKRAMRNSDLDQRYSAMFDSIQAVAEATNTPIHELFDIMKFVEMAPVEKLANYIFKNNGDLTFSKKIDDWGFSKPTLSFGAAYADLDNDGDLELIVNNTDDYPNIYKNNSIEKEIGNYLRVLVKNKDGSPAYGARVKLFRNNEFWQLIELTNVRGYKSKSEDIAHFGLGAIDKIEKIEIIWPEGRKKVLENVRANQFLEIDFEDGKPFKPESENKPKLFTPVTNDLKIAYLHKENEYDDYEKQILLPHKMSNFGPGLAVGDVNGDDLEDFYLGGASGFPGVFYMQNENGTFTESTNGPWEEDKIYEDLGAELIDIESDGDLDLYVVSGGNEFNPQARELQDRLYLNDGRGNFSKSKDHLPEMFTSGSRVIAGDFDRDGDPDLFVGGRLVPGRYPYPAQSYLLRNDNGKFTDITDAAAPVLKEAGMVTSATWTDFNGDGLLDLVIVGEWMPVTLLENQDGIFKNVTEDYGLGKTEGWYYSILAKDMDNDGDMDLIAGNLGLNYKYKASDEEPFEVYTHDFDDNGSLDIVLGYHEHGDLFPVRGRSCSSQQVPEIAQKFPTFESFGEANLKQVYGQELDEALHYKAYNFASLYIENQNNNHFIARKLPNQTQLSSINNIIAEDFNLDGHLDLIMSGNLYPVEIETPRNDGNMGMFLTGDGKGNFTFVPITESGFFAPHDAKDMKMIRVGKGKDAKSVILVANNQYWLQAIEFRKDVAVLLKDQLVASND